MQFLLRNIFVRRHEDFLLMIAICYTIDKIELFFSIRIFFGTGNYKKCTGVSIVTINGMKQTCGYLCDVTDAATMEIKMMSTTPSTDQPAICDVKLY